MSVLRTLRTAFTAPPQALDVPARLMPPPQALQIALRPIGPDDEQEWDRVRYENRDWLAPWDSGDPMHGEPLTFNTWLVSQRRDVRQGTGVQFVIDYGMHIIGFVSLGAISYGSMRSGTVGYWVSQRFAGRGVAPLAVALLADWALDSRQAEASGIGPRLHRLQIDILPENVRSKNVMNKLHAHAEGRQRQSMYVRGAWRDHDTYSLLAGDAPEGFAVRFLREQLNDIPCHTPRG